MIKRLLIAFLALIIIGALPYFSGLIAKHQLTRIVNQLTLPEDVFVEIEDYHVRYARSWAQLKITVLDPSYFSSPLAALLQSQSNGNNTHTSYVRLKVFHGPIFPDIKDHLTVGLGRVAFYAKAKDLAPNKPILEDALENFFEKNEIISGNATLSFFGKVTADFTTAPAYYKSEEGSLSFDGITGKLTTSWNLNSLTLDLNVAPLSLQGKNESEIQTAAMTLSSSGSHEKDLPWVGTQTMSLPSFYLRDEMGKTIRFSHFKLDTSSHVKDSVANITLAASANDIEFLEEQIKDASLKLVLDELDAKGLAQFTQITHHQDALNDVEWQTARRLALVDMFEKGAHLSFIQTLDVPQGHVIGQAEILFPNLEKDNAPPENFAQQMILNMRASVTVHAPLLWLEETLYKLALPHLPPDAPAVEDPQTKQTMPATEALRLEVANQFNALNSAQVLITEQGMSAFDLRYESGKLLLNGKALTPEDIARLMSILEPMS